MWLFQTTLSGLSPGFVDAERDFDRYWDVVLDVLIDVYGISTVTDLEAHSKK